MSTTTKITAYFMVIIVVVALLITSQLSSECATPTTDSAQSGATDHNKEVMTTATADADDYIIISYFIRLANNVNVRPESSGSIPMAPQTGSQRRSAAIAGYLKLSWPNTEADYSTDNENMQTLPRQRVGFMSGINAKKFVQQRNEDIATTDPGTANDQPTTTTLSKLFSLPTGNEDTMQKSGASKEKPSVDTYEHEDIITPQYVHFIPRTETKKIMEQFGDMRPSIVSEPQEDQSTMILSSKLFTPPEDDEDYVQLNGKFSVGNYEHENKIPPQYVNFIPRTETKKIMEQFGDMRASIVSAPQEYQSTMILPSKLFTPPEDDEDYVQLNGKPQNTAFEAHYDDETTVPQYVRFIPRTSTKNSKVWSRKIRAATASPSHKVGITTTSPPTLFPISRDDMSMTQENGQSNDKTVEAIYEATFTAQDAHNTPRTITKKPKEQGGGIITTTASSVEEIGATSTPLSMFFTIPSDNVNMSLQNGEPNDTIVEDTTTLGVDIIPYTSSKNAMEQVGEFTSTTASSPEEVGTTTTIPRITFTTPIDDVSILQQNGESDNVTVKADYDVDTTTPLDREFISETSPMNAVEQVGEVSSTTASSLQVVGTTSNPPPITLTIPSDDMGITQHNVELAEITFEVDHEVSFVPHTRNENCNEWGAEFNSTTTSSAQEVGTTTTTPSIFSTVPRDDTSMIQQNDEPIDTTVDANLNDLNTISAQDLQFSPSTSTKRSKKQGVELIATTASSAEEIETYTTPPSTLFTIPSDGASITQQGVEPTNIASGLDNEGTELTTSQDMHSVPLFGSRIFKQLADELNTATASSTVEVRTTLTSPSPLFTVPVNDERLMQQNAEHPAKTFEAGYEVTELTTLQNEHVMPRTGINNSREQAGENISTMPSAPRDSLPKSNTSSTRLAVQHDNANSIQQEDEFATTTIVVQQEDDQTSISPLIPFTLSTDNENIAQPSGGQNITLISEPSEAEPTTFPHHANDKNLTLQSDKSEATTNFETDMNHMASANKIKTLSNYKPDVTTIPTIYEEHSTTKIVNQDTTITSMNEEVIGNKATTQTPSVFERSPFELLMLYRIHIRMLKTMSVTLAAVVALILLSIGCKYWWKIRCVDGFGVPSETVGRDEAGQTSAVQPSTSLPSITLPSFSEVPCLTLNELLYRED